MRVTVKGSLWVTVGGLVAGQVPDDEGLVTGTGKEHVWAALLSVPSPKIFFFLRSSSFLKLMRARILLHGGSQTGDPAAVALEVPLRINCSVMLAIGFGID